MHLAITASTGLVSGSMPDRNTADRWSLLTRAETTPKRRNALLDRQEGADTSLWRAKRPAYSGHVGEGGGRAMGRSRVTSAKVASKASKALSDGRSSARTKSIAASALSQAKGKGK